MLAALVGLWHRGLQKRAADMHELLRHSVQMMGILSQVCIFSEGCGNGPFTSIATDDPVCGVSITAFYLLQSAGATLGVLEDTACALTGHMGLIHSSCYNTGALGACAAKPRGGVVPVHLLCGCPAHSGQRL
jgi:hypothetical protein